MITIINDILKNQLEIDNKLIIFSVAREKFATGYYFMREFLKWKHMENFTKSSNHSTTQT